MYNIRLVTPEILQEVAVQPQIDEENKMINN
jgi:hypothetical protein